MTTKIQLSAAEMQLMCNADFILTKNVVLQKTKSLLEEVQHAQLEGQKDFETFLGAELFTVPPKISRGENYLGLPYLILDYPRLFQPQQTFAIRTFFWWGRFFSCTLQLSGDPKFDFQQKLVAAFHDLALNHFVGINADPWQHHFEEDNYKPVSLFSQKEFETFLTEREHIKLAVRFPLTDWQDAQNLLFNSWQQYLQIVSA